MFGGGDGSRLSKPLGAGEGQPCRFYPFVQGEAGISREDDEQAVSCTANSSWDALGPGWPMNHENLKMLLSIFMVEVHFGIGIRIVSLFSAKFAENKD